MLVCVLVFIGAGLVTTVYLGAVLNPMFLGIDQALGHVSSAALENLSGAQLVRFRARTHRERQIRTFEPPPVGRAS